MSKLLVLDIETRPAKVYTFQLLNTNIGIEQVLEPGAIIAVGARWLDGTKEYYAAVDYKDGVEVNPKQRRKMLEMAHSLLSESDAVITFNGDRFDLQKLRGEFAVHGLPPLCPTTSIDVRRTTSAMGFTSGKLAHVGPLLGCGRKRKHDGFTLWSDYLLGTAAARKEMKLYNLQDVHVLADVYKKVRPYIKNHPNLGYHSDSCPVCGSLKEQRKGKPRFTPYFKVEQMQCRECQSWFDGKRTKIR